MTSIKFSNLPYWLRGGIILPLTITLITVAWRLFFPDHGEILHPSYGFVLPGMPAYALGSLGVILFAICFYFVIGAIVGFVYEKFNK